MRRKIHGPTARLVCGAVAAVSAVSCGQSTGDSPVAEPPELISTTAGGRVNVEDIPILGDNRDPMVAVALSPPRIRAVEVENTWSVRWDGIAHGDGDRAFVVVEHCPNEPDREAAIIDADRQEYLFKVPVPGCGYSVFVRDESAGSGPPSARIDIP